MIFDIKMIILIKKEETNPNRMKNHWHWKTIAKTRKTIAKVLSFMIELEGMKLN